MYFGYGTCTVIPICFNVLGHWGFVCLLPGGVYAKFFWVRGFYLRGGACYGYYDYLVWGLCVFEPFYRNVGFCGPWITVTPILC